MFEHVEGEKHVRRDEPKAVVEEGGDGIALFAEVDLDPAVARKRHFQKRGRKPPVGTVMARENKLIFDEIL